MVRLVAYVVGSMVSVLALGTLLGDDFVKYESESAVLIFSLIMGVLLAYIKPVLKVLTLPLTCVTFGLFALALNALLFAAAARLTPGLDVSLWGSLIGAVLASLAGGVIFSIVDERS